MEPLDFDQMNTLILFALVLLFFVPGLVGAVLGQRSRSWWWPILIAGLAVAGLLVIVGFANANAFGDEGGAGFVVVAYLLLGAWCTVTAVVGVLIGKALRRDSRSGLRP